jgi:integrase
VEFISHISPLYLVALVVSPLVALRWIDIDFDFKGRWFIVATDTGIGEKTQHP